MSGRRAESAITTVPTVERSRGLAGRQEGGYITILKSSAGEHAETLVVYRSGYVHVAVGHPVCSYCPSGVPCDRRLPPGRGVNTYEPHEYIYEAASPQNS